MLKKNWFTNKTVWLGACVGMLCMGLMACATTEPAAPTPEQPGFDEISEVHTERDGASTVVILGGLRGTQYTAYPDEDFNLVVVEVPSATIGASLQKQLSVYDGVVREVSVAPFTMRTGEPLTRVEISLAGDSTFEVVPSGDHLKVRVTPTSAVAAAATTTETPATSAQPIVAPADANAPLAKTLKKVEAQGSSDGTVLHFRGDGKISEFTSFALSNPTRLVIDLAGIKNQAGAKVSVNSAHVAAVRLGAHPDKVRVVIDAGSAVAPFEGRWIVPTNDGLLVTLGAGADVDAALAAANSGSTQTAATPVADSTPNGVDAATSSEPVATAPVEEATAPATVATPEEVTAEPKATASTAGGTQVYGVSHEHLDAVDRVVISTSQPVEYRVFKPNDETVMLSLINAHVDGAAAGRITPEQGGSIAMVSTFQQPDLRTPEVRVVITRASGVEPQIKRDGSMIIVDVANGQAAALPPAVAKDESAAGTVAAPTASAVNSQAGLKDISPESILIAGGMNDKKQYIGKRISLDFKDAEISSILRLIADVSDLNVIAGDDVKGQVTLRLVDIPWDQALDVVLATKGLSFTKMGSVLRVAPTAVIKAEEAARMQEARDREKLEDLEVKLVPVNYGDVKDAEKLVKKLLSSRGTVNIDKRTNTLIVKDIASVVREAEALTRAVDTQTPQVLIEAKIVEASMDFSFAVGTRWGAVQDKTHYAAGSSAFSEDFKLVPFGTFSSNFLAGASAVDLGSSGVAFDNGISQAATGVLGLEAMLLDGAIDLVFSLALAEAAGEGKVISSPRVVTLDNMKATVKQGVEIPYPVESDNGVQIAFKEAVLSLEATPHITADQSILMKLKVTRDNPNYAAAIAGLVPIDTNQVESEALVKDGQTLVLGGIYVLENSSNQTRLPYLYKVPIVGALFKNKQFMDRRRELLVFITPRIVRGPSVTG